MLLRAKTTRVDNAYERLKSDILTGELPPGFQAPEPDIAARLRMSRTPVREALIRLEAEGLLELVPRRGARVLSVTAKDFCEIQQILATLEGLAASIIAERKMPGQAFKELDIAVNGAETALQRADLESFAEYDDLFHRFVGGLSNRRLQQDIDLHLNQIYRANKILLRMNNGVAAPSTGNRDLLEALKAGCPEQAELLARTHRLQSMATMSNLFESSGLNHL